MQGELRHSIHHGRKARNGARAQIITVRETARQMLQERKGKINVFTTCDFFACGLIEEVRQAGLTPGEDVRIVGFDDEPQAQDLGLTTLHQPVEEMGHTIARFLMERIENPDLPVRSVQFEPTLKVRSTT